MMIQPADSVMATAVKPWVKQYDRHVQTDLMIPEKRMIDLLELGITLNPGRLAFHYLGKSIRYRELDIYSAKFAAWLTQIGIQTGEVVGLHLPNIPEFMIALIGAFRCGCVVTGISPLLSAKELQYQLRDADVRVLVTLDTLYEKRLPRIQHEIPALEWIVTLNVGDFIPYLKRVIGKFSGKIPLAKVLPIEGKKHESMQHILASTKPIMTKPESTPDSICLIQYTGGTTGLPKGAELTNRNLVANTLQAAGWLNWKANEGQTLCSAFPFFHMAGLCFGLIALSTGNTQCLIPDPRNTAHICREIASEKVSVMANVPTLYQLLLDSPQFRKLDFATLKLCVSGAAPFSVEAINALEAVVGKGKVMEVYGLTEASPLLTMNPLQGLRKPGSVGLPMPNTEIRIVDVETGQRPLPPGEPGELIAAGPQITPGYRHQPEETARTLRSFQGKTWLYTGDVAYQDQDGYLFIVDRVKDMLIIGGYKVFSREVEEVLYQHPAVALCALIGIPDQDRPGSELVKLVIQLKTAYHQADPQALAQEIIAYCRERLAPHKTPKIVEFTTRLPLTPIGKVDKKALR